MEKEYKSSIKGVRLTQEEKSIVESIQKEQQLSDFSKAVCYILHDYLRQQEEIQNLQQKNQKLEEANQKQMTRIRLASNGARVSTQTVIESFKYTVLADADEGFSFNRPNAASGS